MTIKEKILKIMSLALEINPPKVKNIGQKKTAVFVDWSPHCNNICVCIYLNGWSEFTDPDERYDVYLTHREERRILNKIIARLEKIKELETIS